MSRRVIEGLVAAFSAREVVPLLDESNMNLFVNSINFVSGGLTSPTPSLLSFTFRCNFIFLTRATRFQKSSKYRGDDCSIHASISTSPSPSMPVRPHSRSQIHPPSHMQIGLSPDRTPAPFPVSQPPLQNDQSILIMPPPTAKK